MLLTEFLRAYDHTEVHSISVKADPHRCFDAVKHLTPSELSPLVHILFAIRSFPARLKGGGGQLVATKPIVEQILGRGFIRLAEDDDRELVLGTIGRFWQLAGRSCPHLDNPQAFVAFDRPGYAKAAMNFYVDAQRDGSTIVSTETRIRATDAAARRKFARYWRIVHPGSALIRRIWLKAIKQRAERG